MPDQTEMKCGTCKFFGVAPANGHSTCHVYAPGHGQRGFPIVDSFDWCGQWATKTPEPPRPSIAKALDSIVELKLENNVLRGRIDDWIGRYNEMKDENATLATQLETACAATGKGYKLFSVLTALAGLFLGTCLGKVLALIW